MKENKLTMKLLKEKYGVCRFDNSVSIPSWAFEGEFYSISKTEDELSIVCLQENIAEGIKSEKDWRVFKVEGPLDFFLVGILSKISGLMAEEGISIFAISTYDTDYILIKEKDISKAIEKFVKQGYCIVQEK